MGGTLGVLVDDVLDVRVAQLPVVDVGVGANHRLLGAPIVAHGDDTRRRNAHLLPRDPGTSPLSLVLFTSREFDDHLGEHHASGKHRGLCSHGACGHQHMVFHDFLR